MYPDSFLQWLATVAAVFGLLILFSVIVIVLVEWRQRRRK